MAFSLIGQAGHPKRFAGLFSAAPSVALASLAMTVAARGPDATVPYAEGMLMGSAGMVAYSLFSLYLIDRLHAHVGSIVAGSRGSRCPGTDTWWSLDGGRSTP